ncbi:uncharacterized protein LOC107721972 [Sinocyclocheilus rhinocerous]|uniref:uncharacterized protein LOC107721972 n=1 Tax=Sinocyclocheilus rhinocerous TaxID=307959 RepID=UPI0007BA167F|nr:PREDICTED: uncharacterized protein LOC107721972 [Sinocyclocheilus rhinocerous]
MPRGDSVFHTAKELICHLKDHVVEGAIQDTYGCINWDVKFLPLGETPESQQEKKEKLKMMSQQTAANLEEVKHLMKLTFYTQRKQVNQGKNIKCLLEEWPFWFNELGMAVHFKELTGIGLKETFTRNLELKGKRLLNYFSTVGVNKNQKFLQAVTKCNMMREQVGSCSQDVTEMLLLLLSYFNEKEDAMYHYVEDTSLAEEVEMEKVNLTPTLVVCGQTPETSSSSVSASPEPLATLQHRSPGSSQSSCYSSSQIMYSFIL